VTLPEGYRLERDPDVLLLLTSDGLLVAAFSARGATQGALEETAWGAYDETAQPRQKPKPREHLVHALG